MTPLSFDHPGAFLLAPLAVAPLLRSTLRASSIPSLQCLPADSVSDLVDAVLKLVGVTALLASLIGAAGPFFPEEEIERVAEGAQIVMLIDRSGSMNETFAGRNPSGGEESKAAAAKRILKAFVDSRRRDLVGVAAFSTSPMLVTPLSDHPDATKAAIDAMDRPGLDYTNIARGLAMALSMFRASDSNFSRAILLISDGAGVIDPRIQDNLRADFRKTRVNLYWLFLRTEGSRGIYDSPEGDAESPQAAPERHLDLYFKSLGVPYRAFEAEGPEATENALQQIDRLERRPMRYFEKLPRRDLGGDFFAVALCAAILLLVAKLSEVRLSSSRGAR
ncbi:vWA domain-containing protein [Methylocystis parvus]|uniref:VWA domain-containing protein n=1 Tax=Methylocystis parvus TaxID=134 RepID=A0A6B8M309_9HYPH|nr:vWA domain-containing protein [Methylocystis parvus]QGM96725.1 VWA domain-containing protein [Methylocystis parvus]WBJ99407.1 VWA domain-containing protein [Methylocystis parvus OBBP]